MKRHFARTLRVSSLQAAGRLANISSSTSLVVVANNSSSSLERRHFSVLPLRRRRSYNGHFKEEGMMPKKGNFGKLDEPYEHGEKTAEDYLKKTSLSPWAPVPDAVARRLFDIAKATPQDFHVDLGSGDGRVNFHAIDYGLKKSLGIDVDGNIVKVARERLSKRHPPPDLEFMVADLLDPGHAAWAKVQQASIITMYFAEEALKIFRPLLESKLAGCSDIKIVTCGYEMPGWATRMEEVVLGTTIYLYEWKGTTPIDDDDDDDDMNEFINQDLLQQRPEDLARNSQRLSQMNGNDNTGKGRKWPIRGFNPDIFLEEEDSDEDWDAETSEEEDEEKERDVKQQKEKDIIEKYTTNKKVSACSKFTPSESSSSEESAAK